MRKLALLICVICLMAPCRRRPGYGARALDLPRRLRWADALSIFNWSTYIAEDTVPNFEEACGVTVNYDIYESNEAMLARIRQGNPGYDIIVPERRHRAAHG